MKKKLIFFISILTLTQGFLMSATIENITINQSKIPVIFDNHTTLPIFNLQLVFQNGGFIQDGNKSGLTNIVAKLFNEGTKKDGAVKFAKKLENKAISLNASNGFETFVIEVNCLKEQYKTALKLLNQLLKDPNVTQSTLDKLKTLQLSKLQQKENDFDYIAQTQLKKILWANTPLENPNLGTQKTIEAISLEDVNKQIKKILNIDNLIIVTGGDIDFKTVQNDLKPIIKNFQSSGKSKLQTIQINTKTSEKIVKKETQQAYIYFGSPFNINSQDIDNYKAKVASFILGGSGFGSRLMEEIRVKRGLAYSAYGSTTIEKSHSYFTGYLQTKLENQEEAKQLVKDIVINFVNNGVTQKELDGAKQFILGSEPLRTETFSQRQNRAFKLYYKGLDLAYYDKELKLIEQLSLDDLNDFIKQHKEIENLSFSILTK